MPGSKMKVHIRAALADMDLDRIREEIRLKYERKRAAEKLAHEAKKK